MKLIKSYEGFKNFRSGDLIYVKYNLTWDFKFQDGFSLNLGHLDILNHKNGEMLIFDSERYYIIKIINTKSMEVICEIYNKGNIYWTESYKS